MDLFLDHFLGWLNQIISIWQSVYIEVAGIRVNFFAVLLGALLIGFCISVFWKGART